MMIHRCPAALQTSRWSKPTWQRSSSQGLRQILRWTIKRVNIWTVELLIIDVIIMLPISRTAAKYQISALFMNVSCTVRPLHNGYLVNFVGSSFVLWGETSSSSLWLFVFLMFGCFSLLSQAPIFKRFEKNPPCTPEPQQHLPRKSQNETPIDIIVCL